MLTKRQLDKRAERLAEQQQKFVETLYMLFEVINGLQDYLKEYGKQLEAHRKLMKENGELFTSTLNTFQSLVSAFTNSNLAVQENNEKLDKFIVKMEAYFGSGTGLEYDN